MLGSEVCDWVIEEECGVLWEGRGQAFFFFFFRGQAFKITTVYCRAWHTCPTGN